MSQSSQQSASVPQLATEAGAEQILVAGLAAANGPVSLACFFSVEDVVLIDILHKLAPEVRVFALDTGRLNEETYEVAEALRERYSLAIDWFFPER